MRTAARVPACISYHVATAARDTPQSAAFSRLGVLDVLASTTPRPSDRKHRISRRLAGLATRRGKKRRLAIATLGLVLGAASSSAAEWRIEVDPLRTNVSFTLKATMHSVHGTAAAASGGFSLDPDTGAATGEIVIDATSADTGNGSRDKKMHRKVLVTADNPQIVFRIQRLEGHLALEGASEVTLHGEIMILGQAHEIAIPLQVEIDGGEFAVKAEFEIPYVEWGLKDPSTFILRVAKEVQVVIEAEGRIIVTDGPGQ